MSHPDDLSKNSPPLAQEENERSGDEGSHNCVDDGQDATEAQEEEEVAYTGVEISELSIRGVFPDSKKQMIERAAGHLGPCLRAQSCRDFERSVLTDGILKPAKITGGEQPNVILMLLILLVSETPGKELRENLDKNTEAGGDGTKSRSSAWIGLLGQLLLFAEMYTWPFISGREFKLVCDYIPLFMYDVKTVLSRKAGNQMRTLKFHMIGHIMRACYLSGPLRGLDGSFPESHMKGAKKAGRQTSRRQGTFAAETSLRENENILIKSACHLFLPETTRKRLFNNSKYMADSDVNENKAPISFSDHTYTYSSGTIYERAKRAFPAAKIKIGHLLQCEWGEHRLQRACELILDRYAADTGCHTFELCAEAKITCDMDEGDDADHPGPRLFRGCPSQRQHVAGRHDWGVFQPNQEMLDAKLVASHDDKVVGRIISFVRPDEDYTSSRNLPKFLCLVQPLKTENADRQFGQTFLYSASFPKKAPNGPEARLFLLDCSTMIRPIAVVPDRWDDKTGCSADANNGVYSTCRNWIVIEPKSEWHYSFVEQMQDRIKQPAGEAAL